MKDKIKDKLITLLGGYTKTELKGFKKSIRKHIEKMKLAKGLNESERQMLYNYRTDVVFSKAKAKIELERGYRTK